jgi:hypothetical protein
MSEVKNRLIGAITVMDEAGAQRLWAMVQQLYADSWDTIEEVQPDELDLQMIRQIQQDPDCQDFVSAQEAQKLFQ